MSKMPIKPLIGVSASTLMLPQHSVPHHSSGEKYLRAVAGGAGGVPMLIAAIPEAYEVDELAQRLDGLFLTGGRANIEPHHYGGAPFPPDEVRDSARDNVMLPLIRACVRAGVPIFGVCRGIQEINVALGGTLHYRVHEVAGMMDHRMPREGEIEVKFGLRHSIALAPDGMLADLVRRTDLRVNSAHGQGLDRLGDGLVVEALAPDGLVEAVRLDEAKAFCVGVQWHAEWRYNEHELSNALFAAFGAAASERAAERTTRLTTA